MRTEPMTTWTEAEALVTQRLALRDLLAERAMETRALERTLRRVELRLRFLADQTAAALADRHH